jgi:hypothetical protein
MAMDTPIPPFRNIPRSALFRVLMTEREPKEMSIEYVGETGYAVFATMSVSSQLAGHELEECVGLVRSLVGEVAVVWNSDADKQA